MLQPLIRSNLLFWNNEPHKLKIKFNTTASNQEHLGKKGKGGGKITERHFIEKAAIQQLPVQCDTQRVRIRLVRTIIYIPLLNQCKAASRLVRGPQGKKLFKTHARQVKSSSASVKGKPVSSDTPNIHHWPIFLQNECK